MLTPESRDYLVYYTSLHGYLHRWVFCGSDNVSSSHRCKSKSIIQFTWGCKRPNEQRRIDEFFWTIGVVEPTVLLDGDGVVQMSMSCGSDGVRNYR
jgi:hypothetical protein